MPTETGILGEVESWPQSPWGRRPGLVMDRGEILEVWTSGCGEESWCSSPSPPGPMTSSRHLRRDSPPLAGGHRVTQNADDEFD